MNERTHALLFWISLVKHYFGDCPEIADKLLRINFDANGNMIKKGKAYKYAEKKVKNLILKFEESQKEEK